MLTIDILFPDAASFDQVSARLPDLTRFVSHHYAVPESGLKAFVYAPARAIKFTLPRATVSGSAGDTDVYGAQQHQPLLAFEA